MNCLIAIAIGIVCGLVSALIVNFIGYRDTGWDNEDNEQEIVFCPIINQGRCLEDAEAKKHRLCPLVPVPPHGRLIDADRVRNDIDKKRPGRSYEDAWALTIIDAAPTIIPAEEGET